MSISSIYKIKCLFGGEASVGKSSIVHLLTKDNIETDIEPTIGMSFAVKNIELEEYSDKFGKKQSIKAHTWDSAGSMRFRSIVRSYLRDLDIVFLVFDLNERRSWDALIKWKSEIEEFRKYDKLPLFVIVGNKSDRHKYEVTMSEIDELCKEWNAKRYIISCKESNSSSMIKRMFYFTVKEYHEHLLWLKHNKKELPEHVTDDYCESILRMDIEPNAAHYSYCCYQ